MAERDFGSPTKSRTAHSAAAPRSPKAILEFAGLPKIQFHHEVRREALTDQTYPHTVILGFA
jgi:hypothetical protein